MPALFIYSLKFSVCLAVIYLFYYLILRNLTFYNWNRWFLLISTGLCFLLPMVNVLPFLENNQTDDLRIISAIPTLVKFSGPVLVAGNTPNYSYEYEYLFISIIFGIGVLLQAGRLIVQFVAIFRIRRAATQLQEGAIKIYQVNEKVAPFSFGNAIYLNKNLLQPAELIEIIRHEQVHIEQKHTLDVLWLECLCLYNWYNPFVWLLKAAVRQNLEFIVDHTVLANPGFDKKYYQYLLLKVIALPSLKIANQFNISSLKTRISMMNKIPSNKWEIAKFLFALPMMTILILACQDDADKAFKDLSKDKINVVEITEAEIPTVVEMTEADAKAAGIILPASLEFQSSPPSAETINKFKDFLKQNPDIKRIITEERDNEISSVTIKLKSGKNGTYNFKNNAELAKFLQRYGDFPVQNLPPPPPPVPTEPDMPPPPPPVVEDEFVAPFISFDVLPADQKEFIKRNPTVKLLAWNLQGKVIIYLKSGKEELYDLTHPVSEGMAEKKYGKLPKSPAGPPFAKFNKQGKRLQ